MIEITGKYASAKVFTEALEPSAEGQIQAMSLFEKVIYSNDESFQYLNEMSKEIDKEGNIVLTDNNISKVLTLKQYEEIKKTLSGSIIGVETSDGIIIKSISDHAFDRIIIRGYGGSHIADVLKTGKVSPDKEPDKNRYEKKYVRIIVGITAARIITVIRRDVIMKNLNLNLQENVNMEFIDLNSPLRADLTVFLEKHFNVSNVDKLSNYEYHRLYDKLCDIEVHETCKADDEGVEMSDYGNMIADIVTYMGNQFIEGGKRYHV
jgi:hypothetical protein